MPPVTSAPVRLPAVPRGPLSEAVLRRLTDASHDDHCELAVRAATSQDVVRDDDIQLTLFMLYSSSYGSIPELAADLEWDPDLIETRRTLETAFEAALRAAIPAPSLPEPTADAVARALFALTGADSGPSLSRYLAKKATLDQAREFLIQRSVYTLREADPHSWAIPRLHGRATCQP